MYFGLKYISLVFGLAFDRSPWLWRYLILVIVSSCLYIMEVL